MGERVAVIGGGVAGLGACRALSGRGDLERVVLFEASERLGGHVHTEVVDDGVAVDMGFIVFNDDTYPHFTRMLEQLGVPSRATNMSFSVRAGDLEFGSASLRSVFAQRRNLLRPGHYRFVLGIIRFVRQAARDLDNPAIARLGVHEYLRLRGVDDEVTNKFVTPLMSALWSMAPERVGEFPAATLLRFLYQHGMLAPFFPPRWRTVVGGSRTYVDALVKTLPVEVHLATPVARVIRDDRAVDVELASGFRQRFDRVVMACHADTAVALLADPSPDESRVLGAIRFSRNDTWLHTDESFLPRSRDARASWNYDANGPGDRATVTYDMTRLQGLPGPQRYLVTLNPQRDIAPEHVRARAVFEHPLFDAGAIAAQTELPQLQGTRRTYYCGAYCGYGFHEDGLRSGMVAAARVLADSRARRAAEVAA
jgi:predicted NAD/FAD-binding protein